MYIHNIYIYMCIHTYNVYVYIYIYIYILLYLFFPGVWCPFVWLMQIIPSSLHGAASWPVAIGLRQGAEVDIGTSVDLMITIISYLYIYIYTYIYIYMYN